MNKTILLGLLLIPFFALNCSKSSTCEIPVSDSDEIYVVVQEQADFPGGVAALYKWIDSHLQYPTAAKENNIQGKVVLRMVIEKDGSVNQVVVVRQAHELLDNEAVRLLNLMPKWKPATNQGKIVRSFFTLPIEFKL